MENVGRPLEAMILVNKLKETANNVEVNAQNCKFSRNQFFSLLYNVVFMILDEV